MVNTNNTPSNNNSGKIEDFGQKIGGARKDLFAEAREWVEMVAGITPEALASAGLSKLVKKPNFERLTERGAIRKETAAACLILWRSVGTKPRYTSTTWGRNTRDILERMAQLITTNGEDIPEKITTNPEYIVLLASGWPLVPFSFGSYEVRRNYNNPEELRIVGGHYWRGEASKDPQQIAQQLREMVAADEAKSAAKRAAGPALSVYRNRAGVYFIAPDGKPEITLYTSEDRAEAFEYMRENRAALCEKYAALKQFPAIRRDWNRPRVGEDWRKGENITPETFAAVLPFRGVEFGNWVNQTERAALLNSAFDGFHDLAAVLGIAPESVTLSGSLAFAFASRGHSAAAAHYEPARQVINLTKKAGAGCMAHEWFHAVDNFAAGGGMGNYATESPKHPEAFAILEAIKKSDYFTRSKNLARWLGDYWTSGRELTARAFEGVIMSLLSYSGICSDFLANVEAFDAFTEKDVAHRSDCYPYPTADEAAALLPLYIDFLRVVFGDCVKVCPAALADSERAQAKAKADQEEAERIRAQRAAEAKAEAERKAREAEAEQQRKAEESRRRAEITRAAIVETMTARHFETIRTAEDSAAVYFCALLQGDIFTGHIDITNDPEEAKRKAEAAPLAMVNYKYCHNAKRIIIRSWRAAEAKSSHRTAAAFLDALTLPEVRRVADSFREFEKVENIDRAAAIYADTMRSRSELMNSHHTTTPAEPVDNATAPAEGLELVNIPDGVAITGNTYPHRREIKAKGCKWNKAAQRWEATTPEAVESVRAWFGVDAPAEPEQLPEPPAVVYVSEPCPPTPSNQKTDSTPTNQKTASAAPIVQTIDTDNEAESVAAAEALADAVAMIPAGIDAEGVRIAAHGVALAYCPQDAARMVSDALQLAASLFRRYAEINNVLEHFMDGVTSEEWEEYNTQRIEFEVLADDVLTAAYAVAHAVGVDEYAADNLATLPTDQPDPAQVAMAFETPATDAEVLETATRIRANYEAMKAEAEAETTATPSQSKNDTDTPAGQKIEELPEWVKDGARCQIIYKGKRKTGYIDRVHLGWRSGNYICIFYESGTLFDTPCTVSELLPLEQDTMAAAITRERRLAAIGYPFTHLKNPDGSYNIPTVNESLYWEYAAGLITLHEAAQEFCKSGWTNFVDEKYTLKEFKTLNNKWHKLSEAA